MAIKIEISISKRLPIVGVDYSSRQAAITISGEITDLTQINAEAARLFTAGESVVDRQLNLAPAMQSSMAALATSSPEPTSSNTASASYSPRAPGRRSQAPISPAQLRYLGQLLDRNTGALAQILADHHINKIEFLSSRDASTIIDRLKAVPA